MVIVFHTVCLGDHGNFSTHYTFDCRVVFWSQLHRKPSASVSLFAKSSVVPILLITGTKCLTEHLKEGRIYIDAHLIQTVRSSPPVLGQTGEAIHLMINREQRTRTELGTGLSIKGRVIHFLKLGYTS